MNFLKLNTYKINLRKIIKLKISIFILLLIIFFSYLKYVFYFLKLNYIHIAMSLNNNYTYPIMVSLTSIIINKKETTFIYFHLIIDNNVKK